jgi:hypothetical protein
MAFSVDCPAGQIYNGEACVTPAAPDQLFESQRFATLFVQMEKNDTAAPEEHYRSLDLKGGVAALAYENKGSYMGAEFSGWNLGAEKDV